MDYEQEYRMLKDLYHAECREDYKKYLLKVHPKFIMGKHIKFLADKVQDFLEDRVYTDAGDIAKILVISIPPQHGKSMTITETLPSWYLGNNPDHRVIIACYNTDFAKKFGRRNMRKIQEFGEEIFGITLDKERDDEFEIKGRQGACISRGILSGITGNPAELIIIDDPIKNREEASSQITRDKIWGEYLGSVKTRLAADGKIILIMTRWHKRLCA